MEDQEKRPEEEQEDVEGHGRVKHGPRATDEPSDEAREDEDFELHGKRKQNR